MEEEAYDEEDELNFLSEAVNEDQESQKESEVADEEQYQEIHEGFTEEHEEIKEGTHKDDSQEEDHIGQFDVNKVFNNCSSISTNKTLFSRNQSKKTKNNTRRFMKCH